VQTLSGKLATAERHLRDAQASVAEGARKVAVSAIPRLLSEAVALRDDLEGRRQVLRVPDLLTRNERSDVSDFIASAFPFELQGDPQDHPAAAPWGAALAALEIDAGATLPTK
jgi:hypothetical protein